MYNVTLQESAPAMVHGCAELPPSYLAREQAEALAFAAQRLNADFVAARNSGLRTSALRIAVVSMLRGGTPMPVVREAIIVARKAWLLPAKHQCKLRGPFWRLCEQLEATV